MKKSFFKTRATTNGLHLFNRESGLNVLLDEFQPKVLSKAPANVSIALTGRCNIRCAHCFVKKSDVDLDKCNLLKWLRQLDDNGCLGVGMGGGEPFLYRDLVDVCRFVHEETAMACTITTNGSLIGKDALSWMKKYVDFCRISLDGVKDIHFRERGIDYQCMLQKIEACAIEGVRVGVNYLINDETVRDLNAMVDDMSRVGASELLLLPEVVTHGRYGVSKCALEKLRDWCCSNDSNVRVRLSAGFHEYVPEAVVMPGDARLRAYAHIDCFGVIKKTSFESAGVKITDGIIEAYQTLTKEAA